LSTVRLYIPAFDYKNYRLFEIFHYEEDGKIGIAPIALGKFSLVQNAGTADWILIPVFITELLSQEGRNLIRKTSEIARKLGKPFGLYSNSDFIVDVEVNNVYLFTPGAYQSKPFQIDLPATLPVDPYKKWIGPRWEASPNSHKPSVGFCGQATTQPLKVLKDLYTFSGTKIKNKLGLTLSNPGPVFLPAFQRATLLKIFDRDPRFITDFILRNQYKAGAVTSAQNAQVERDFFQNINKSLFTVCLRGMGNYSVRFFQTLAMGRIPILIDTDCQIPFKEFNQLDLLIPIIPFEKRNEVADVVYEYFISKTSDELIAIQGKCRDIWMEYYQKQGLIEYTSKIMQGKGPRI
jgi:hypothetical protein